MAILGCSFTDELGFCCWDSYSLSGSFGDGLAQMLAQMCKNRLRQCQYHISLERQSFRTRKDCTTWLKMWA